MMVRVFVNGFGTIGRRIADAVFRDPEMTLIGVSKYRVQGDPPLLYNLFVPEESLEAFKQAGYNVAGTVREAVEMSDIVVDASKDGKGVDNLNNLYDPADKPAILQGGEDKVDSLPLHNSRCNYDDVRGERYVQQGSCNVTGIGRIVQPLLDEFGDGIDRFDVQLIRRVADLEDEKEVKDSIEWDPNPHHADDVMRFLGTYVYVEAVKVPSRMMHFHSLAVRFSGEAPKVEEALALYEHEFGVAVLYTAKGTADVRTKAQELGFPFGDTGMVHIHANVVRSVGDILKIPYSDDQTGIVVPENHMLVQAMMLDRDREEALRKTDEILGITERKKRLEAQFA